MFHMQGRVGDSKVILIHGLGRFKGSMENLALAFRNKMFDVVNFSYLSLAIDISEAAKKLNEVVCMNASGKKSVHLVSHSLGGIVVRRMMKLFGDEKIGAVVMIAPPNNGSSLAKHVTGIANILGPAGRELADKDYIDSICAIPEQDLCIIAGTRWDDPTNIPFMLFASDKILSRPHDGTVSLEEASLPGATVHLVEASHTWIPSHPDTLSISTEFVCKTDRKNQLHIKQDGGPEVVCQMLKCLQIIAKKPSLAQYLNSNLNVEMHTMGGRLFWLELLSHSGWKIQQNAVMGNCRLLDPHNQRKSWWSDRSEMQATTNKFVEEHG
jgi:hypothetical protein